MTSLTLSGSSRRRDGDRHDGGAATALFSGRRVLIRRGPSPLLLRVQSAVADPVAVIIENGRVDAPAVGRPELLGEDVAVRPAGPLDLEPDAPAVIHPGEACYRHGFLVVRGVRLAPQRRERRLKCIGEIDFEGG